MIPAYTEEKHYENLAFHYVNASILLKCTASVHVEDFDDAVFWEKTFTHFQPNKKFNFIWASNTLSGHETTGSAQCLKYKNYLSNRFFICIDSDYRYLLQDADTLNHHFIVQTYTYSIENHLCYAAKLNAITEQCTGFANTVIDFEAFLLAYSNAVYEAFIWHLYFLKQGDNTSFSKEEFNRILSLNGMQRFNVKNNGEAIINELQTRCTTKTAQLKFSFPEVDLQTEKSYFAELGLNQENAYLYVRGHNLYDLIVKIGKEVNNQVLSTEAARKDNQQAVTDLYAKATPFQRKLDKEIVFGSYPEIEKICKEINLLK
jgi:hypothetical protein